MRTLLVSLIYMCATLTALLALPGAAADCSFGDTDGDGIPDQCDPDDDNDGVPDGCGPHPRDTNDTSRWVDYITYKVRGCGGDMALRDPGIEPPKTML